MNKTILLILVSVLLTLPKLTKAQDARFSQYFNNPLVLNPAWAGNGIEYIRVTAIYRNQWAGMGTPFTTQGFSVDKKVNRVGLGAAITRNGAGDAGIRTMNIVGNLSYNLPIGSEKINVISAGVQVGIVSKSFDPSKLSFDSQYNPDAGYDPSANSNEVFTETGVTRPDVNIGLAWQRGALHKDIRFKPFFGASMSHVTRPNETFIVDDNRAPIKNTFYGGAGYLLNEKTEIRPSFMYLKQDQFKETTFGSLLSYQLDNKNSVQLGAFHRMNDAIIAYAGYQMNLLFVGMSYDVNTSELSQSGKGTNAFEISLTYSPRPKKVKEIKKPEIVAKPADPLAPMETVPLPQNNIEVPDHLEFVLIENNVPQKTVQEDSPQIVKIQEDKNPPLELAELIENEIAEIKDFDKDGIEDNVDDCPYIKGNPATRGCPDSDNDGLIDMQDNCPMESGPASNKGCPDPNVPVIKNNQELIRKYDNILFATGSIRMTTDDIYDIIERAIDVLYADKNTEVILSGHTDAEGDEFHNMNLSQSRTNIVKTYMMKQGIAESRIKTVAYGETMPLENNLTPEGKKLNRRVEINILKKQK
ncbi:MAG: PorP/SprF family type IX secretion system membrane protein [Bacteroidetes bacterium]|nr:PorP/SprF family type IX secretion system membrane protein [Bacteroidota bacterium]